MDLTVEELLERNSILTANYLWVSGEVHFIDSLEKSLQTFIRKAKRGHYSNESSRTDNDDRTEHTVVKEQVENERVVKEQVESSFIQSFGLHCVSLYA